MATGKEIVPSISKFSHSPCLEDKQLLIMMGTMVEWAAITAWAGILFTSATIKCKNRAENSIIKVLEEDRKNLVELNKM